MGKCAVSTAVNGDLKISVDVIDQDNNNKVLLSLKDLAFPTIALKDANKVPPGLYLAGDADYVTEEAHVTARIDTLGNVGDFDSRLKLTFKLHFYADCPGPYCINYRLEEINATISFEYDAPGLINPDLAEIKNTFKEVKNWDCKQPDWKKCCSEEKVEIKFEKETNIQADYLLTISGKALLSYEVWHSAQKPEDPGKKRSE